MKKLLYIIIALLIGSCNNNSPNSLEMKSADNYDYFFNAASSNRTFTKLNLAEQKLQELYDLSLLQKQHPEFEKGIEIQLSKLSKNAVSLPNKAIKLSITNVVQIGNVVTVSDSISKLKLRFDVISEQGTTATDSIIAVIKAKTIFINNETVTSTKITFENY